MAYTKTTDFASKDSLLTGDPAKVVKGSEIDAEFDNIEAVIGTTTGSGAVVLATSPDTGDTCTWYACKRHSDEPDRDGEH